MKNSRVFDNCFLPINIASRVIILKAVSNSKKKKKTLKNNYREILFSNRFVSLSLSLDLQNNENIYNHLITSVN